MGFLLIPLLLALAGIVKERRFEKSSGLLNRDETEAMNLKKRDVKISLPPMRMTPLVPEWCSLSRKKLMIVIMVVILSIFVIITIKLITEKLGSVPIFASELIMGLIGGVLSASLAFLFVPVFENVFGFITQSKLLELANSELPIFRQMAIEAPGSYHHSLLVASLAESAAEEIKMDPMLVKASALYHDIGKIKRPEYFIENKMRNPDIHQDLTPSMSALVIINHVKEGM